MPKPTTASTRKRKQNQKQKPEPNKRQKPGQTSIKNFLSKRTKTAVFYLPNELLYNIFIFLSHQSIVNLALTCKAFSIVTRGFLLSTKSLEKVCQYLDIGACFSKEFKHWGDITPVSLFTYISKTHELTLNDVVQNMPTAIIDVAIQARAPEINSKDIHKRTPLHYAAQKENGSEVTEKLLAAGANTEVMDIDGKTPLHYAAESQNGSEVMQQLLAAGANAEATDVHGKTPLHYAAESQNGSEVMQQLLAAGANAEATDVHGKTPLHYAAESQNGSKVMQQLLAAGANAEATDVHGAKPLHYAAFAGYTKNILTLTRVAVSILDLEGRTPLHYAMNRRSLNSITTLLQCGADVNKQDKWGKTPLHHLLENDGYYDRNYEELYEDTAVVQELLLWNADVKIRDNNSQTPLHYAARNNNLDVMAQLLNLEGVDVNVKDLDGRTPLHHCVIHRTEFCARKLINAGASVEIRDKSGKTAILYAVSNNDIHLLLILLEGHAKLDWNCHPIIFDDGISEPERILIAKILLDNILCDEYRAFIKLWRDYPSNSYTPRWNILLHWLS